MINLLNRYMSNRNRKIRATNNLIFFIYKIGSKNVLIINYSVVLQLKKELKQI